MKPLSLLALGLVLVPALWSDPAFLEKASGLLSQGRLDEAKTLTDRTLDTNPDDADALVVAGTIVLYTKVQPRLDDSIYRPNAAPSADPELALTPAGAEAVAAYWKRVPALDPSRSYLWGDLAQLTFRAGDAVRALDYAAQVLADPAADPDALRSAASVYALGLDWGRAAQCLARIPGNRTALLYRGLEEWRTGKDGWRITLKAFADDPGADPTGSKLAAYLAGPAMRDGEAGYLAALQVETGVPTLAVRQKYVERYPDKFAARLDLARTLSQYGSFDKALFHFKEIDRKFLASTADEKQTVLFQQAWAYQGAGRVAEAAKLWQMLDQSRDFYVRSAAAWFLGHQAVLDGKPSLAKELWTWEPPLPTPAKGTKALPVGPNEKTLNPILIEEPMRSKYAFWATREFHTLP